MSDGECELLSVSLEVAEQLRLRRPDADVVDRLAERWRVVADPLRLVLLDALSSGPELCVCDLAWITGRADNLVSHHLRILRAAGLVGSRKDGKLALYRISELGRGLTAAAFDTCQETLR